MIPIGTHSIGDKQSTNSARGLVLEIHIAIT